VGRLRPTFTKRKGQVALSCRKKIIIINKAHCALFLERRPNGLFFSFLKRGRASFFLFFLIVFIENL